MLDLSSKDKKILFSDFVFLDYVTVQQVDISIGSFYVKKCTSNESFKELLGKKVFDIAGIKCPEYHYFDGNFVISEDMRKLDNFMYIYDIKDLRLKNFITFDMLSSTLCDLVNNKYEMRLQVCIMHFIDILFSNIDRHLKNYGISIDKDGNGTLVVFDNGLFLENLDCATKPYSHLVTQMFFLKKRECEYFINNLTDEEKSYIYELFSRFNPLFVAKLFEQIEIESLHCFDGKLELLMRYIKNYMMVQGVLNKCIDKSIKRSIKLK